MKQILLHRYVVFLCNYLTCWADILQEQSKSDAEKLIADVTNLVSDHIRRQKELVCFVRMCTLFFSNFLLTYLFYVSFQNFINSRADRSTQDWLILEKVLWQTRHSWMDMFHRWKALQQMQKGNGRHFLHKRKVMPKIVLITLLQNIAIWRNSFSNGKFGSICCSYSWLILCICSLILSFFIWLSVNTAESAFKHLKRTHESVNKMGNEHVSTMASIIRSAVNKFYWTPFSPLYINGIMGKKSISFWYITLLMFIFDNYF